MKPDRIPLVWDNGQLGSVVPDAQGILRLRHVRDEELRRELGFAKGATALPSLAPYHFSPPIDAAEITALVDELAWHRK
jgi:hypothetical protein